MVDRFALRRALEEWTEWYERASKALIPRSSPPSLPTRSALGITGVRRGGKTYTAVEISRALPLVLYFNFEDPIFLTGNDVQNLDTLVSVYTEMHRSEPELIILDEIQNILGWEKWVRKATELQKHKIIVTGSSSKLLSSELSTALAGRVIERKVWPLSFAEYLLFSKKNPKSRNEWGAEFRYFLEWGGFPEIVLLHSEREKKEQLQQYLSDIVLKDVMSRNQIRSKRTLDQLVNYYFTNVSCLHSYTSLKRVFQIGVDTAAEYTSYLSDAFLLFEVSRYHRNLKSQVRDPKKVYVIDTALRNIYSRSNDHDYGKLSENVVFIELMRKNKEVYYYKENQEVDFLIIEGGKPVDAIQVTYSDMETVGHLEREKDALLECLRSVGMNRGKILTLSREEEIREEGKLIELIPTYKWMAGSYLEPEKR